jgi:hypothetical protein
MSLSDPSKIILTTIIPHCYLLSKEARISFIVFSVERRFHTYSLLTFSTDAQVCLPRFPVYFFTAHEDQPEGGKGCIYPVAGGSLLNAVTGNAWAQFGYSVSRAGDVNADRVLDYISTSAGDVNGGGYDDVFVSVPYLKGLTG